MIIKETPEVSGMNQTGTDLTQMNEIRESDRNLERLGDFEDSRCKPVPGEIKEEIQQTLNKTFPDLKPS